MTERRTRGIPPIAILGVVALILLAILALIIMNLGAIGDAIVDVWNFIFDRDSRNINIVECADSSGCRVTFPIIYSLVMILVLLTGFAYTTLLERKLIAWFQHRVGPNRVGPDGFLQPLADGIKLIFKEDIMPSAITSRLVYLVAPMIKAIPTLIVVAVIPLGPPLNIPWFDGNWYRVPMGLIDPGVAVLYILAVTSLGTYGVVLAGWASNNKYSMLGGLRGSAQMVSYELSMGLGLAVPVMLAGSMSLVDITEAQSGLFVNWFVFQNPLAAAILTIALIAEVNRSPFDLPEAEQELTAGFMTEYSGMKFALFMMAEYLGMIAVSLIAVIAFFGGYQDGFGLVDKIPLLGPLVIFGKVVMLLAGFIWIRATLPRIRYDRLMMFGWKIMLPLGFLAVVWTAVAVIVGEELGNTAYILVSTGMAAVLAVLGIFILGGPEEEDETAADEGDPVITGERAGMGWALATVVGGLVSMMMQGYSFTLKALEGLAQLAPPEEDIESALPDVDSDEPVLPSKAGGD